MSFYYEWIDFVSYPKDPNRVITKSARLNCSQAIRTGSEKPIVEDIDKYGWIVTKENVIFESDDEFEVAEITESGRVLIFTKKRVWTLQNQGDKERLIFLPRHPQFSHFEAVSNKKVSPN